MKKIYNIKDLKMLLDENFIIHSTNEEYETSEKLQIECRKCGIKSTKQVNSKLNNKCRNCNMKEAYTKAKEDKIFKYDNIISYYNTNYQLPVVKFICPTCGKIKEKLFANFVKTQECTNCFTSKTALIREQNLGDKYERFVNNIKNISANFDEHQKINLEDDKSTVNIECSHCKTFCYDKIWRISKYIRKNKQYMCPKCTQSNKINMSAYNLVKFYTNNSELGCKQGYFYTYCIQLEEDIVYKIGITRCSVEGRIAKTSNVYNVSDVRYIEMTNLDCAIMERHLKNKYKNYKILPTEKFEGYTECFSVDVFTLENIEVQRLELKARTSEVIVDGSGQPN